MIDDQDFRVDIKDRLSLIYIYWKRHLEGDALREKYLILLRLIRKYKPKRLLSNARTMYYTTVQDARWLFEQFLPMLIESSVTRYARLESPQSLLMLDSMTLQDRINLLAQGGEAALEFRFYTDEEQAVDWLVSQP